MNVDERCEPITPALTPKFTPSMIPPEFELPLGHRWNPRTPRVECSGVMSVSHGLAPGPGVGGTPYELDKVIKNKKAKSKAENQADRNGSL